MKNLFYFLLISLFVFQNCTNTSDTKLTGVTTLADYFDNDGRDDILTGGVKMIDISTDSGDFKVWTKRIGNNPTIKVLLLHGGPGFSHEYLECFDSYFPKEGIEYYYYDQLGSYYSDQPSESSLLSTQRFVEEVEQVRQALNLDNSNFYLFGHSWGGILAMEYALKYQENLKGLIISNMMSSIPEYNQYANEVLAPQLDPAVLTEIRTLEANKDFENPRYMELLLTHYYTSHILRLPLEKWPEPLNRAFKHFNPEIYIPMQGPSELGVVGDVILKDWERKSDLTGIAIPTLSIGAEYDTMDPEHMKWMASQFQQGRYLYCPNGSHSAMYDDQKIYFEGIIKFIMDVDKGSFN
ncbi:MAG: proline iminopeptidase-family hydrolase [Bacteroidales bacterium]|nr:proline iminopeptidase-family hydrolase [Bacteroidales bacterium]